MRRVVVNGRFFAQRRTGVQRYAVETLRALDRLLSERPQYLQHTAWQLALPRDACALPLLENFEIQTLQFLRGHPWEQVSLAAFARDADAYLVNFSYSGPLAKRKQLITVHDAAVRAFPQAFSRSYRLLHAAIVSLLAPRVECVMTVSRFAAGELRLRFGLTRDDVLIGREGWEHASAPRAADDVAVLRRHGLTSGRYLLAVGSTQANKNFGLIPRALRLLDDVNALPVAVAGACDPRVFRRSDAPGDASLRWLGFVPDDDLYALYRHAAWFVFPSLYEGFGLPPLEAMANGCPVLAARAGPIAEIYGDAVLTFDAHDPASLAQLLRQVTHDDTQRGVLRQRAAACLVSYRWQANAEILLDHLITVGAVLADDDMLVDTVPRFETWLPTMSQ